MICVSFERNSIKFSHFKFKVIAYLKAVYDFDYYIEYSYLSFLMILQISSLEFIEQENPSLTTNDQLQCTYLKVGNHLHSFLKGLPISKYSSFLKFIIIHKIPLLEFDEENSP